MLLGLKQCSRVPNNSSSNTSSEPTYNYDTELLKNQFIKIVNFERQAIGYEEAPSKVVAVSYTDNYPNNFSISITASAGNTLYYYNITNHSYSGDTSSYDNCIGYISTLNIFKKHPSPWRVFFYRNIFSKISSSWLYIFESEKKSDCSPRLKFCIMRLIR